MSIAIPNGAVATYVAVWSWPILDGATHLASTMIAQVGQELVFDGLAINNYNAGNINFFWDGNLPVTVQILNQSGQELDDSDMVAQVADAVASTGGTQTTAYVSDVTGGGDGTNTGTGQTHATTPSGQAGGSAPGGTSTPAAPSTAHQCGDPTWAWYSDIPQAISCMESKLLGTLGLLFIGLIIGVVLIVGVDTKKAVGV